MVNPSVGKMYSGGSYSSRFKQMESEHEMHITQIHQAERMDMIARNKKLQQETNRRRKALAVKRKLESQREEKRRQEILAKRREQQRRATEKYQRLNKHYRPESVSPPPASNGSGTPLLEDALQAIRGSPSHHVSRGTSDGIIIRHGSAGSLRGGGQHRGRVSSAGSGSGGSDNQHATSGSSYHNVYRQPSGTLNARTAEHAREVAVRTELHSNSLRNLTNSRSLFEAHLEQHQHQLAEHQRQALSQFNAAIRKEIDTDATLHGTGDVEPEIVRSNSVSSVDSLEDEDPVNRRSNPVGPIGRCHSDTNLSSAVDSATYRHNTPQDGAAVSPNLLQASQSEVCLPTYAKHNNPNDTLTLTDTLSYTPGVSQHPSPGTFDIHSHGMHGSVTTNTQGGSPPGFSLHRSLSSGSNVAVVQPISSISQKPNSIAAAYVNKALLNYPTPKPTPPSVQYGGYTQPVTNGFYQGSSDFKVDEGQRYKQQSQVQGKDGGLVGPISAINTGISSQYNTDHVINNVAITTNTPFYLGSFSGSTYTAPTDSSNSGSKRPISDAEFHARTKAWSTPTSDVPTVSTVPGSSALAATTTASSLATNVNPYSSRLTATNVTLTTASSVIPSTTSQSSVYTRPTTGPVPVTSQGYVQNNSNGTEKSKTGTVTSHYGKSNGGYSNGGGSLKRTNGSNCHDTSYNASYGNHHYASSYGSNTVYNGSSQGAFQTGTVYSKGSIPSTVIVGSSPQQQSPQAAVPSTSQSEVAARSLPTTDADERASDGAESEAESSEEEPEAESQPEVDVKNVKGILKATFNANQPTGVLPHSKVPASDARGKGYTAAHQARSRSRSANQGVQNNGAVVRDSLEVARQHLGGRDASSRSGKKSVRFAEQLVEEQEVSDVCMQEPEPQQTPAPVKKTRVVIGQDTSSAKLKGKPPRPVSAKVSSTATKVEDGVRESRIASAGSLRRGPAHRPSSAKVTVSKQTVGDGGNSNRTASSSSVSSVQNSSLSQPGSETGSSNALNGPIKSNYDPVYDGNGLRLDRTPTDDEINWLWDKVRTCLSRTSTVASQDTHSQSTEQGSTNGRQTATISSKYIDGNALAPQFRTATRVIQNGTSMAASREPTINGANPYQQQQRKKISMEHLNSYGRKNSGLLSQRKPVSQSQVGTTQTAPHVSYVTTFSTPLQPTAAQSGYGPTVTAQINQNGDVTESMAAFLTAEVLAQQSVSDSRIEDAMEAAQQQQHAYNVAKPQQKVPTALSIEEQRLLQSLERLNERLKMTETSVGGAGNYIPRPPPYDRGFRGHHPLSATRRQYSASPAGTVNRHHSAGTAGTVNRHHSAGPAGTVNRHHNRVTSAGNVHTNYGGQVRYHH